MMYILGRCALEKESSYLEEARFLKQTMNDLNLSDQWYYKASFSKENRSSINGEIGQGLKYCIPLFKEAQKMGLKTTTDVHSVDQIEHLVDCIDLIQIPAMLARQTPLMVECAKNFNMVHVKKMQHLGPNNMNVVVDKIKTTNPDCVAIISDRGTNLGTDHLVIDHSIIKALKEGWDLVGQDPSHGVHHSRKIYGNQGDRNLVEQHALACPFYGYDFLFLECCFEPWNAISDADTQIDLNRIPKLIKQIENNVKQYELYSN